MKYKAEQIVNEEYEDEDNIVFVEEKITGTWRWGTTHRRVAQIDGELWAVNFRAQPEEGVVSVGKLYRVEKKKVTVVEYVAVPNMQPISHNTEEVNKIRSAFVNEKETPMREKYVEEKFPRYFEFGSSEVGKVDVVSVYNETVATVSKEQAAFLISDRNTLVNALCLMAAAFDQAAPEAFKNFWYK